MTVTAKKWASPPVPKISVEIRHSLIKADWGCCKTSKKVSNSLFLLFEQKVGGIISHDRRKSWLILQILRGIYSFTQTFRLRKYKFEKVIKKIGIVFIGNDKSNSVESF
jgi:hypothetical protein